MLPNDKSAQGSQESPLKTEELVGLSKLENSIKALVILWHVFVISSPSILSKDSICLVYLWKKPYKVTFIRYLSFDEKYRRLPVLVPKPLTFLQWVTTRLVPATWHRARGNLPRSLIGSIRAGEGFPALVQCTIPAPCDWLGVINLIRFPFNENRLKSRQLLERTGIQSMKCY